VEKRPATACEESDLRRYKTVYIGTGTQVSGSENVEINFDDRPNVNAKNFVPCDPFFNTKRAGALDGF
jgi:hypothetical protein